MNASPVRVIGLAGSLRDKSYTRRAVEVALEGARQAGASAELIDLRELKLPFCHQPDCWEFPDVARLREAIRTADGILLGTPEYHGSFSGVLKNALDLVELEDICGRVLGLVGVSGGSTGPGAALLGLRSVARGLAAWVLPAQVAIAAPHKAFDEHGQLVQPEIRQRLLELGAELTRFAELHATLRRAANA